MDEIRFYRRRLEEHQAEGVGIEVNGTDLATLVREVELPFAEAEGSPGIAGGYSELSLSGLEGSLPGHFLGGQGSDLSCGPENKTVLLGCECGVAGCWPLMTRVRVLTDTVVWSDFEQPHRSGRWRYEALGSLTFARHRYERALADLRPQGPSLGRRPAAG